MALNSLARRWPLLRVVSQYSHCQTCPSIHTNARRVVLYKQRGITVIPNAAPGRYRGIVNEALLATRALATTLHVVAPWWLAIPMFAVTLSLAARIPFIVLTTGQTIRRQRLAMLRANFMALALRNSQTVDMNTASRTLKSEGNRFDGKYCLNNRILYLQLPFSALMWLLGHETIRRLSGSPSGMLGLFSNARPEDSLDKAMTNEGVLWFTDLTVSDPYHILPVMLGGIMFFRIVPRTRLQWRNILRNDYPTAASSSRKQIIMANAERGLKRLALIFPIVLPWLVWDLSSGPQLYWLCAILTANVFGVALRKWIVRNPWAKLTRRPPKGTQFFIVGQGRRDRDQFTSNWK